MSANIGQIMILSFKKSDNEQKNEQQNWFYKSPQKNNYCTKALGELMCETYYKILEYENTSYTSIKNNGDDVFLPWVSQGIVRGDKMYMILFGRELFRRGTMYYGLQYSANTKKFRILPFSTNLCRSEAISFGSMPSDQSEKEVLETSIQSFTDNIELIKSTVLGTGIDILIDALNRMDKNSITVGC